MEALALVAGNADYPLDKNSMDNAVIMRPICREVGSITIQGY